MGTTVINSMHKKGAWIGEGDGLVLVSGLASRAKAMNEKYSMLQTLVRWRKTYVYSIYAYDSMLNLFSYHHLYDTFRCTFTYTLAAGCRSRWTRKNLLINPRPLFNGVWSLAFRGRHAAKGTERTVRITARNDDDDPLCDSRAVAYVVCSWKHWRIHCGNGDTGMIS